MQLVANADTDLRILKIVFECITSLCSQLAVRQHLVSEWYAAIVSHATKLCENGDLEDSVGFEALKCLVLMCSLSAASSKAYIPGETAVATLLKKKVFDNGAYSTLSQIY